MALSPNYGWSEPDNSSLVKNGAADIRTLGDAIDTSLWNVGFGQAAKNKILNSNFSIWQRGTSITFADNAYTADRFITLVNSGSAGTGTVTQQTFTPGTAPVAGYEGQYFWRYNLTATGTSVEHYVGQKIEDVRTFAGQTVTFSFWGKADSARTITSQVLQLFGSGGSGTVATAGTTHSFTTSWQRFSVTISVPSVSGKTIGTGSSLLPRFYWTAAAGATIDTWGWQLEYGSKATPFQTASGGSPQAELAMCQRYYVRTVSINAYGTVATPAIGATATLASVIYKTPVTMRVAPSSIDFANVALNDTNSVTAVTALTINRSNPDFCELTATVASGLTQYRPYNLVGNNTTAGYVGLSAEL